MPHSVLLTAEMAIFAVDFFVVRNVRFYATNLRLISPSKVLGHYLFGLFSRISGVLSVPKMIVKSVNDALMPRIVTHK